MNNNGYRFITYRTLQIMASTLMLAACSGLSPPHVTSQNIYVLESGTVIDQAQAKRDLVLAVSMPRALSGFDTSRMAYVKQPHELNYFATSRWADAPAKMLGPLVAHALEQRKGFKAVVQTSAALPADVRLDIELVRLQQDFTTRPSRVQLTLWVQLIDVRGKRLLAVREFDEFENASSEDAYGGVIAANRLVQRVLGELAEFSASASDHEFKSGADRP